MATAKQEEIKVRVTGHMKARVVALAEARGESESVIVREALNAYLVKDEAPARTAHPSAEHKVSYKKSFRKPKGKVA